MNWPEAFAVFGLCIVLAVAAWRLPKCEFGAFFWPRFGSAAKAFWRTLTQKEAVGEFCATFYLKKRRSLNFRAL